MVIEKSKSSLKNDLAIKLQKQLGYKTQAAFNLYGLP
jgi:plasmid maintenance system antidote protein VapI